MTMETLITVLFGRSDGVLNIFNLQRGVTSDKRYSRANLDTLSAMLIGQKMVCGPGTNQRRMVARLAMAFAMQNKTFR